MAHGPSRNPGDPCGHSFAILNPAFMEKLGELRAAWPTQWQITSVHGNPAQNRWHEPGARRSRHQYGYAADLQTFPGKVERQASPEAMERALDFSARPDALAREKGFRAERMELSGVGHVHVEPMTSCGSALTGGCPQGDFLGIQTDRDVQEFVASHGAAALPYLDEAFGRGKAIFSTAETWGYLLGPYRDRLSGAERVAVVKRVWSVLARDETSFEGAARIGGALGRFAHRGGDCEDEPT